jgi:hypothetical protein
MTTNHRGQDIGARVWMHGVEDMRSSARRGSARKAFTGRNVTEQEAVEMQDQYGAVPVVDGDPEGAGDAADQWLQDHRSY